MTLNYQIALTSVAFDNSYKNVLRFDTRSEQEAYFKVDTLFSNSPKVNFNVGSLYATDVVYDCNENDSINELLNKNYVIVKDNSENATYKYYYYFVTNAMQGSGKRITMSLELDIFQTYYIDLKFSDSTIFKAHLDRFIDNGDGTVSFDGRKESKLFEREEMRNVAKRMTSRSKIGMFDKSAFPNMSSEKAEELAEWLNYNVIGWIYIYCVPNGSQLKENVTTTYTIKNISGEDKLVAFPETKLESLDYGKDFGNWKYNIPTNIAVLCYPLLIEDKTISFTGIGQFEGPATRFTTFWGERKSSYLEFEDEPPALEKFAELNNGYGKILSITFSYIPPMATSPRLRDEHVSYSNKGLTIETTIENPIGSQYFGGFADNLFLENEIYSYYFGNMIGVDGTISGRGLAYLFKIKGDVYRNTYSVNKQLTFEKNEIINADKNVKFNPKLLSSDFFELTISDATEDGFVYDLQKLNTDKLRIKISSPLMPGISKTYIRFTDLRGVYIKETANNLTGFVSSDETSLTMPTSAYQNMLAQNKNFFLQNSINRSLDIAKSLPKIVASSAGGAVAGAGGGPVGAIAGAIIGGATSSLDTALSYAKNKINENLTVDNLKNAPASVVQAKGDALFQSTYSPYGVIIEEWDILDNEKEIINDYMCMYGFTYNRIDNVKNVDNIRKYYNFVRADIEAIHGVNISERVHQRFREIFANGVRFWNVDTFSYEKENYERWLEND